MLLQKYTVSDFLSFLYFSSGTTARVLDALLFPLVFFLLLLHFSGYFEIKNHVSSEYFNICIPLL